MRSGAAMRGTRGAARASRPGALRGTARASRPGALRGATWFAALAREELGKLGRARMLPAVLLASLALNGSLIFGRMWLRPVMLEVGAVAAQAGVRVDGAFLDALASRPGSDARDQLLASVGEGDVPDVAALAARAAEAEAAGMDTALAAHMARGKYQRWERRAESLVRTGAVRDVYAGPITHEVHDLLFGTLMPAVIAEAALVGVAALLYAAELDVRTGTAAIVSATAYGWRAARPRLTAALLVMLGAYAALALLTFGAAACTLGWGMGPAWESSVGSARNIAVWGASARPFVPWADFSVATYLFAEVALGALVAAGICLMAHALLLVCGRHAARTAVLLCLCVSLPVVLCKACTVQGLATAAAVLSTAPAMLLALSGQWFTDLGGYGLVPWQETASAVLGVGFWVLTGRAAMRWRFGRDVA